MSEDINVEKVKHADHVNICSLAIQSLTTTN